MTKRINRSLIYIFMFMTVIAALSASVFAVNDNQIKWMSHADYLDVEGDKAWIDPKVYMNYTAEFNTINYTTFTIANVVDNKLSESIYVALGTDSQRNIGHDYKVVITDYFVDTANKNLWYKVEAAEGYSLPEELESNPYVLYLTNYDVNNFCAAPYLFMLPKKAMIVGDSLIVNRNMTAASAFIELNKEDVPDFFDVTYVQGTDGDYTWYGYDLGEISLWDESYDNQYHYVNETAVTLIPVEVTVAYEQLLNAKDSVEYNEILNSIPDSIKNKFTDEHKANTEKHVEELIKQENIKYETTIDFKGKQLPISVKGKIPQEGVKLSVSVVDNNTVLDEGFDIKNVNDIIAALDIKILNTSDNSEWQPDSNIPIELSIDMASLGYEDGTIFGLYHKHSNRIDKYEVFVVMDGKLTIYTGGFSLYVVTKEGSTNGSKLEANNSGSAVTLEVGNETVYYCSVPTNNNNGAVNNQSRGTWSVEDTSGAIYYTVHTSNIDNVGHGQKNAPWIKIIALKETTDNTRITLRYRYGNNGENVQTYYLNIVPPKATESSGVKLYIKDRVNTSGNITATLVDKDGNEILNGLEGAAFSWSRSDNMFITPRAYSDNYRSVNIAKDHAGLVEARKNSDGTFDLVTYTVSAILSNGTTLEADYTVYYQSEIINADFEAPIGIEGDYSYFINGWPNLYWKTSAPGSGSHLGEDIEYANFEDGDCETNFGVTRAADWKTGGVQFAELNAEAFGALYQDIITAPGEDIDWKFSHAPRQDYDNSGYWNNNNWANEISNAMYIVIGPTEEAQKLTKQEELEELGAAAKEASNKLSDENKKLFDDGKFGVTVTYKNAQYKVWYHDAGSWEVYEDWPYDESHNWGWTELSGSYTTPDNQFRTRLFFVSEPSTNNDSLNAGNLIDISSAGQYKDYLIEYYVESFDGGTKSVTHLVDYDQFGKALVYSTVELEHLTELEMKEKDYLHRIMINGSNYPYDVRYKTDDVATNMKPCIFIEKYKMNSLEDPDDKVGKDYAGYDIVVQVFLRDTVIAIDKTLDFPAELTHEQKLDIIEELAKSDEKGYNAKFQISSSDKFYVSNDTITITQRNPNGTYTGYVAPMTNPSLNHVYYVEETSCTPIEGLKLNQIKILVTRYRYGLGTSFEKDEKIYEQVYTLNENNSQSFVSSPIYLSEFLEGSTTEPGYKVAEVSVINSYIEKETKINYKAIGNGKVALIGSTNFADTPTETLKYYSGQSIGAAVHPGKGATFVGWFKDEACTIPVEAVDGVWADDDSFKPNANILNADEVTFYAKFVSGSLVINRENAKPGEIFVYHVTSTDGLDIYVSITCDEKGKGSKEITEITSSNYTVTEMTNFSWRYPDPIASDNSTTTSITKTNPDSASGEPIRYIFDFDGEKVHPYWVNGYSEIKKNIFGKKNINGGS